MKILNWFKKNWVLKIISLILATGLWYYAMGEESIEVTRAIPLKIQMGNPQMMVSDITARVVQVTLSAPRALIVNLASQDIQVVHRIGADIKTTGEYSFRIEPGEVRIPNFQIRVVKIIPATVTVKLDEVIVQKLEIQPDFVGEPAIGYKVLQEEIKMDPNAILAQGPKGDLEKVTFAKTEPIDLVGRIRSFNRTVQVRLPPNVKPVSGSLVDVYIPIREEFDEKEFKDISVRILKGAGSNGAVELDPEKVSFMIKGSKRVLEKLTPETLLAYVDISGLKKGNYSLPLQVVLPEVLSLKEKQPIMIEVVVSKS